MNINIIQALNGVAVAAATARDTNTVSLLQAAAVAISKAGTAYDGAPSTTTAFLNPTITPFNGQAFDVNAAVAKFLGVTGQSLGA